MRLYIIGPAEPSRTREEKAVLESSNHIFLCAERAVLPLLLAYLVREVFRYVRRHKAKMGLIPGGL
jgi:hypothetical protein